MNIYTDHMTIGDGIDHDRVIQMRDRDLRPEYEALRVVPSGSQDHAYVVAKVSVLDRPFDEADVVDDRVEIIVCGCDDYWFTRSKDFETGAVSVRDLETCKHATAFREEQVRNDDSQMTF